jgi:chromatin-remodeling ATPase INO80
MKDTVWRMKRLTREMQAYWKKTDKVERELDIEMMEAKRQQRKLNFLITQTELYAHFMHKKLSQEEIGESDEMHAILRQLEESQNPKRFVDFDDYDR